MSANYDMKTRITKLLKIELVIVRKVLEDILFGKLSKEMTEFTEDEGSTYTFCESREITLTNGESDGEFAARLTHAIWDATGRYVPVEVEAMYLEPPPMEEFEFDETDYDLYTNRPPQMGVERPEQKEEPAGAGKGD